MSKKKLLLSISEKHIRESLCQILNAENFECVCTETFIEAIKTCSTGNCFDAIIVDMNFHKHEAVNFIETVTCQPCQPLVIYIIPYIDRDFLNEINELQTVDYIIPPIDFNHLLEKLKTHFEKRQQ